MKTGFVLSMELSADLMFRAKWTNTIMSSSGLLRSFKSIPNCSWNAVWGPSSHHRMGSGHGWDDDGDSDVSVIIVVVSGSEPGDLSDQSERLLVNFPCLHSLDAAGS